MAKRRKKKTPGAAKAAPAKKALSRTALYRILALVALTVVLLVVYRFFMNTPYFLAVMFAYMAIGAATLFLYVIYNRGFSRRGITLEMLPPEWSDEKKEDFLADAEKRMQRSSWLLIVIFSVFFTFALDLLELYVLPTLGRLFGIVS